MQGTCIFVEEDSRNVWAEIYGLRSSARYDGVLVGLMYSQAYVSTAGSSASVAPCDRVD